MLVSDYRMSYAVLEEAWLLLLCFGSRLVIDAPRPESRDSAQSYLIYDDLIPPFNP